LYKRTPRNERKEGVFPLDSKTNALTGTEETKPQAFVLKQLRTLRKKGNLYNQGERWYFMKRNIG